MYYTYLVWSSCIGNPIRRAFGFHKFLSANIPRRDVCRAQRVPDTRDGCFWSSLIRTTSLHWVMVIPGRPADWLPVAAVTQTPKYGTRHHFRITEREVPGVGRA